MRRGRIVVLVLGAILVPFLGGVQASGASQPVFQATGVSAPTCSLRNLSITVAGVSAASNQEAILVRFRNHGHAVCVLSGYPKVVAIRTGVPVIATDRLSIYNGGWTGGQPPEVVLQRGRSASAVIGGGAIPRQGVSTACYDQRFKSLEVSVPGSQRSIRVSAFIPREGLYLPSCAGVAVTPFAPGVGWFLPTPSSTSTTTTLVPESGYRGIENFCAVAPLTGTIHYDGTSGQLKGALTVSVSGLPPDDGVYVAWSNDHVRAPDIADFETDSKGSSIRSSVELSRLGEVRGVEVILLAEMVPNPVLGRLEPC